MKRIVIESPFRPLGPVRARAYLRLACDFALAKQVAPIASHGLFPALGYDDDVPAQRETCMRAGLEWARVAHEAWFFLDFGLSEGMRAAQNYYDANRVDCVHIRLFDAYKTEPEMLRILDAAT